MTTRRPLGRDDLERMASGFMPARVLISAAELDVFDALETEPADAAGLAARLRCAPDALRRLLDALVALDVLSKRRGVYRNTALSRRHLVTGAPDPLGGMMRHRASLWDAWSGLTRAVRTGRSPRRAKRDNQRTLTPAMADIGVRSAAPTVRALERELRSASRLLDLGGGPAAYACAFAEARSSLRVTILDLPGPLEAARATIRARRLSGRVRTREVDVLAARAFGRGYDLAFLSNFVHCFPAEMAARIVGLAVRATRPGGHIVIKDFYIDEDRTSPPFAALFSLNMLTATAGDCYTRGEVEGWLASAGARSLSFRPVAEHSALLVARREP